MAVPLKTEVCLAHSAVSGYGHKQEKESKYMWCFPTFSGSGNMIYLQVLSRFLQQVHSGTCVCIISIKLALGLILSFKEFVSNEQYMPM